MAAGKLDLVIEKGATFIKKIYYKDKNKNVIDLTGYTARMQIRERSSSANYIVELTTANGGIIITTSTGEIKLFISDTDTSAITANKGVYDLELIDGSGTVIKLLRGTVSFIEEITK